MLLGWYDCDVAAARSSLSGVAMERTDDLDLAGRAIEFQGWSILDPGAAAAPSSRCRSRLALVRTPPGSSWP